MIRLHRLHAWLCSEQGQNAVEYGLVTALIAVALIGALVAFRTEITGMFTRLQTAIHGVGQ